MAVESLHSPRFGKGDRMDKYRTLHLWMLVPMVFMQAGIFQDYWGDFSANAWSVHVHYWTGTAWYFYLILQPYLATHGQLARHRTNGIVGVFLTGGVCLTAFSMLHRDLATAERAVEFVVVVEGAALVRLVPMVFWIREKQVSTAVWMDVRSVAIFASTMFWMAKKPI